MGTEIRNRGPGVSGPIAGGVPLLELVRRPPGQQKKQCPSKGINIRPLHHLTGPLFGRSVFDCSDKYLPNTGFVIGTSASHSNGAEIEEFGGGVIRGSVGAWEGSEGHHVLGLHIAMDEPMLVDHCQPTEDIGGPPGSECPRHGAEPPNEPVEVGSVDQFHRDEVFVGRLPACVTDSLVQVKLGDRRVANFDHRPSFLLETVAADLCIPDDRLDGGESGRVELSGSEHFALPALAEFVEEEELIEGKISTKEIDLARLEPFQDAVPLVLGETDRGRLGTIPPVRRQVG